jgi:hypothetical protein
MNALKNLTLKIDDVNTDDHLLKDLCSGLLKFEFLKDLELSVSGNPLTMVGVTGLLTEVSKLPRLQSLHCNLRRISSIAHKRDQVQELASSLRVAKLAVHL